MRHIDNWDDIKAADSFDNPTPGAYLAVVRQVKDEEAKEYLRIEWDFSEGEFKGANQETFDRAGFWPIVLIRSYKPKALPFFKAFKTALEDSNPGYQFREDQLDRMAGKRFGVVLGEEEYTKRDGDIGKRLYVAQVRSLAAIQKGDYKVPALKRLAPQNAGAAYGGPIYDSPASVPDFANLDDDGELPF